MKDSKLDNFDQLWDYNAPEQTEVAFRALLPLAKASGKLDKYAQLLTQIARTHSLRHQFEEAHAILAEVKSLLVEVNTTTHLRYLLEKGRCYNSNNQKAEAFTVFKEAWDLGQDSGADFYLIDIAHMLAIAAPESEQLDWNLKAMELAEATNDPIAAKWKGALYNNIGWTYFAQKDYKKALNIFEKAYQWYDDLEQAKYRRIAKWSIAKTYRLLNELEQALTLLWELDKEYNENKLEAQGYNQEELGECYWLKGEKKAAAMHFKRAYELLSTDIWLQKNESQRLKQLKERADIDEVSE